MILALVLTGGTAGPPIVWHEVMYCASVDAYKFAIQIEGQWDFGTVDEQGRRATALRYLLGEDSNFWTRRVDVAGTQIPFSAEIRFGEEPDGELITSVPMRFLDAESGRLEFMLPTWTFGAASRDLVYSVLVTAYGDGSPETAWTYRSTTCIPVRTQITTWGQVKTLYR
jgi:hypothetical protein